MKLEEKIRIIQWTCHLVSLPAIFYAFFYERYDLLIISIISYIIIFTFNIGITLHRLLSHRSFKTYKFLEKILSFFTVITTVGPTISWVAVHRLHHVAPDTDKDPHSPWVNNKFNVKKAIKIWLLWGWSVNSYPGKYVKDLMRDPTHNFIYENYFFILICYWIIIFLVNPIYLIYVYALPVSLTLHCLGIINVLNHYIGDRPYDAGKSTNSWFLNLFLFGEGWHNNHHANPGNWCSGEKWYEWDLCARIIQLIKIEERN